MAYNFASFKDKTSAVLEWYKKEASGIRTGRATAAVRQAVEHNDRATPGWNAPSRLSISFLPYLSQTDYDHLLWACELNFVRGEDSLVRALWAGKPFVWQIYPQDDDAHLAKLSAFLDWLDAPASLRRFHAVWNSEAPASLPAGDLAAWARCVGRGRSRLMAQESLVPRLVAFVAARSA